MICPLIDFLVVDESFVSRITKERSERQQYFPILNKQDGLPVQSKCSLWDWCSLNSCFHVIAPIVRNGVWSIVIMTAQMEHYHKAFAANIRKPEKKELTKIYILSAWLWCIFRVTSFEGKIKKKKLNNWMLSIHSKHTSISTEIFVLPISWKCLALYLIQSKQLAMRNIIPCILYFWREGKLLSAALHCTSTTWFVLV